MLIYSIYSCTSSCDLLKFIRSLSWFCLNQNAKLVASTLYLNLGSDVIINRDYLRTQLQLFLDPLNGPNRALTVPPSEAPGKSHTSCLLRHVAKALDLRYIFIDCLVVRQPTVAARIIANSLGFDDQSQSLNAQLENQSRPGLTFAAWLMGRLGSTPVTPRAWIVFDHVVMPKADEGVANIANELAAAACDGQFQSLYITLIDSDFEPRSKGFGGVGNPLYRDNPTTTLTSRDIKTFILLWAEQRGLQISSADAEADAQAALNALAQPLDKAGTHKLVHEILAPKMHSRGLFR